MLLQPLRVLDPARSFSVLLNIIMSCSLNRSCMFFFEIALYFTLYATQ